MCRESERIFSAHLDRARLRLSLFNSIKVLGVVEMYTMNKTRKYLFDNHFSEDIKLLGVGTPKDIYMIKKKQILAKYDGRWPEKPCSDGRYSIKVSDKTTKGGRRSIKARTLEELKDKVLKFELEYNEETFEEVFLKCEDEEIRLANCGTRRESQLSTVTRNHQIYMRFFSGTSFSKLPIKTISNSTIDEFALSIKEKEPDLKQSAFNGFTSLLSKVFNYAEYTHKIATNPYNRHSLVLKRLREGCTPLVNPKERELSNDELKNILQYIREKEVENPSYMPSYGIELAMYLGLRRGEIPALRWGDIDKDNMCIHIQREQTPIRGKEGRETDKNGHPITMVIQERTKTNISRTIPIDFESMKDLLLRLKVVHDEYYPNSPYLLPDPSQSTGVITNNTLTRLFEKAFKACCTPRSKEIRMGLTSLRRKMITDITNYSGSQKLASDLAGNSVPVAVKHYTSSSDMKVCNDALTVHNDSFTS